MSKWNSVILGDYIDIITDYHANGAYEKLKENITLKYENDFAIMIRTLNFESNDFRDKLIYLNEREYNYLEKTKVQPYDIIMNKIANPGTVYLMPDLKRPVSLAMNLFLIRFKSSVHQRFIFYLMKFNEGYIKLFANGTATKSITKDAVRALKFKIPDFSTQSQISKILSDLDAKIELNNKINAELEAMAKLIYDYWFVQFDFPNEEGKPYKSSGGKMVWNEELKREIPEGWALKKLNSLLNVGKDQINPLNEPSKVFKHLSIPIFDSTGSYAEELGHQIGSNKFILEKNDLAVSKLNPWFNRVFYPIEVENLICSTEMVVWKCENKETKNFYFQLSKSQNFISYCTQVATGTSNSHKRVNPAVMMQYNIAYNKSLVLEYGKIVDPWISKIMTNKKENKKLAELRDWLLPMLMNGQVKVS
jgi:type I restriction enzyme S subunit